jgi:hypothetical protein
MNAVAINEETMKIGLLMETAQTYQKLAETSLQQLRSHVQGLDEVVRDEIRRTLAAELQALSSATQSATLALQATKRAANLRVTLWGIAIVTLACGIPGVVARWIMPSQTELTTLRAKRDELASNIARLHELGGAIDLRRCGEERRLCVRVDRKQAYGEKADYLVVQSR